VLLAKAQRSDFTSFLAPAEALLLG